jgi:hypothetical protein
MCEKHVNPWYRSPRYSRFATGASAEDDEKITINVKEVHFGKLLQCHYQWQALVSVIESEREKRRKKNKIKWTIDLRYHRLKIFRFLTRLP